ncbi:MAG: T9SS type A sorting domain-containing protein [Candidatus Poribacteria bacterium]|nr:T9SS type A sorting domain-containing protein [Candidatus Poribacteria bacterium]
MHNQTKISFLFFMLTLFVYFNSFFPSNTDAQTDNEPPPTPEFTFTYESIDVPDVDFLAVTASSDFEGYAGYTRSADGEKMVAFTLIDGVFTTYDFPGSQNTYFYAFGNNGLAAGYYEDSEGLHHGVILEDGELREYNFPGAVETEIYGYSDSREVLTGNFIDASGVRRGFSGDITVEVPGATATYADFVTGAGAVTGSYIDAEGLYYPYLRTPNGTFVFHNYLEPSNLEYSFVHGITDTRIIVTRAKAVGDIPRSYVGTSQQGVSELEFPGSVSTEGWNINQDGSVVGHYDSPDGRRHGFIARPTAETAAKFRDIAYPPPPEFNYIYESIDVLGVEFLELTASSDFEGYAGNTKSADGKKIVGFTLIDGVFTTYDFPGSQNTYFYAFGNNGLAAGHYEDSEGLYHGVILEDGELRHYDFPGAVETEIYGYSDSTGKLTGSFIDASGVRRGFSGDTIVEVPGATATYADFVNAAGSIVGSYVDAEGLYHAYALPSTGRFIILDYLEPSSLEYFFLHGINDSEGSGVFVVARAKAVGDLPRSYVGSYRYGLHELKFPGSVSTEGWNINQDGSVVGHYDSPDGRRHGFIARLDTKAAHDRFRNAYTVTLSKGLNMLSVPLASPTPMTAKNLVALTGATTIIAFDAPNQRFIAWTPSAPDDGFPIEGGQGYIVNVPETRNFAFVGAPWTDPTEAAAAAPATATQMPQAAWAFVVDGHLKGKPAFDGYNVIVRNLRTESIITTPVQGSYFAVATADLTRRSVVQVGDVIELRLIGPNGNAELQPLSFKVTPEDLANAVLSVNLDGIGQPTQNLLLQNYPNPFNPETWIPYQLSEDNLVSISIYDTTGRLIRTLSLGFQSAGFYNSQGRAAYWDGRNALGERVASGIYFYQLTTLSFQQTRRLVIVK